MSFVRKESVRCCRLFQRLRRVLPNPDLEKDNDFFASKWMWVEKTSNSGGQKGVPGHFTRTVGEECGKRRVHTKIAVTSRPSVEASSSACRHDDPCVRCQRGVSEICVGNREVSLDAPHRTPGIAHQKGLR